MEINRNGLLYKIAYGYFKNLPEQGNLCPFFWRTIFSFFIVWPIWMPIRLVLGNILAFVLFGYWLTPSACRPINWWPEIKGWRFSPCVILLWSMLVAILCVPVYFLLADWIPNFLRYSANSFHTEGGQVFWCLVTFGMTLIVIGTICSAITKAEWWLVLKAYLKARKEKFCPLITFVAKD